MMLVRWMPLLLLAVACGESKTEPTEVRSTSNPQATVDVGLEPFHPELYVAVVDDRADATALRAAVARSFDEMDAHIPADKVSCWPAFDPAAFHPVNRSVLVVHPSAPAEDRYTSALDVPALSWRTEQRTDAEHAAWSEAVTAALEPKGTATGPFTPLASIQALLSLLGGLREPANDEESRILELSKQQGSWTTMFVALDHDDESDGDPASFAVHPVNDTYIDSVVLPAAKPPATPGTCFDQSRNDTARYAAWLNAQTFAPAGHWPCTDDTLFSASYAGCGGERCLRFTPLVDPDGSAHCTVTTWLSDDEPCDPAFGWFDPVDPTGARTPRVDTIDGVSHRVCEIQQLSGAALASCVASLECTDCEPGWCATQVPELLSCSDGTPYPFRFVGGADRAAWGSARIACERAH